MSPRRVRFTEMEYAVPLAAGPEVLTRIRDLIEERRWRISFPLEVRTTAADDVPLSTATGRESMYIACHRFFRDDSAEYFRRIEQICREFDGRPHWGKVHTLTAAELGAVYPRFEDFRTLRARLDPHAVFGSAYTDSLFAPERRQPSPGVVGRLAWRALTGRCGGRSIEDPVLEHRPAGGAVARPAVERSGVGERLEVPTVSYTHLTLPTKA